LQGQAPPAGPPAPGAAPAPDPGGGKADAAKAEKAAPPPGVVPPAGAPSAEKAEKGEAGRSLPAGVLARVNGRDITVQDYTTYLFASLGRSKLREFIDRLLLEEEGRRLDLMPSPEEVEERVNTQIESTVRTLYKNSLDKFIENLGRMGLSLEDHKAKLRQDMAYRILEEKSILKTRQVSDEDIKSQFVKMYGDGGVQFDLRHILIRPRPQAPGEKKAGFSDAEAKERAEKVMKELLGGAEFTALVKAYSDDVLSKPLDGRIQYQKNYRGKEFDDAVSRLTPENPTSAIVRTPFGYEIIQLVSKKAVKLEDKRDEIVSYLKTRPPTVKERDDFIKGLREKAKVEM
jgi:parvulin-like peptidyl-prolyl isomerase